MHDTPSLWRLLTPYWTYAVLLLLVPVAWLYVWQPLFARIFVPAASPPVAHRTEKRFLTPADWATFSEKQPLPPTAVTPGQRWTFVGDALKPDGSPWAQKVPDMDPDVVILEVQQGWVRYRFLTNTPQDRRAKLAWFQDVYRYVDDGASPQSQRSTTMPDANFTASGLVYDAETTVLTLAGAPTAQEHRSCPRPVLRAELLTDPAMMGYAPYIATGNYRQLAILLMTRQEGAQFRITDRDTTRQGSRAEVVCARAGQVVTTEQISAALSEE
jgi:hypothetical protein